MKPFYLFIYVLICKLELISCGFPNVYKNIESRSIINGDPGEPLFLTPLIEANKIEEAQHAAKVDFSEFQNVTSYSAYLTVNKEHNSNSFFWFFPAQTDYENAPVLLWLQGGPGGSSLFGLFGENGPFILKSATEVTLSPHSWASNNSVIYIDNPVGTGLSFTTDGYAKNETQIGEELYIALQQFFTLFPNLRKNEFYLTGESYAGKYIPAISYTILKKNPEAQLKINLQGLAIGNGLCDPEHQLNYGDYLFQLGLIDSNTKEVMQNTSALAVEAIQNNDFTKAFQIFDSLIDGDLTNQTTLFKNATGFDNYYNYLYSKDPTSATDAYLEGFLQRAEVRKAIHVGNSSFDSNNVEENLLQDVMKSVAPWITEILSNYRVLFYNGQLDIIIAYPLTINFLKNLKFSSAEEYKTAERHKWYVGGDIAGYVKSAGNLTEVLVRNAGHIVPADQPKWALDLITRFTRRQPLYSV